jgi:ATP-dependent RNA helicase DDX43
MSCCAGKTRTFTLPALIHIDGQPIPRSERGGANVLVLATGKRSVLQIEEDVKKYDYRGLKWLVFTLSFLDY